MKTIKCAQASAIFLTLCVFTTLSISGQTAAVKPDSKPISSKIEDKNNEAKKRRAQELARKYRASMTPAKIRAAQRQDILVLTPEHQDVSARLDELILRKRSFATEAPRPMKNGKRELLEFDDNSPSALGGPLVENFIQIETALPSLAIAGASFEGPGGGTPGYTIVSIPPDTTMAVGPNHVVAWVNVHFAIYNKAGVPQLPAPGFIAGNTIWAGFGGVCETTNRGDPIVQYDRQADRWVFSQFAFAVNGSGNPITPYRQCFAISQGPNPAGPYYRYSYSFDTAGPTGGPAFNDYGKIGIWNDGYYVSYNAFGGSPAGGNVGATLCAYDKASMLLGGTGVSVCAPTTFYGGGASFLPADLEGSSPPTDTTRGGLFLRQSTAPALRYLRMKPDFVTPANTTIGDGFGGATGSFVNLPTPGVVRACNGGTCVPQPGTANVLDTLADRLMYRLSYRNRGGVDSLIVTHSVDPDGAGGVAAAVKWYEIRNPLNSPAGADPPVIYQSGTFNPDTTNRWMSSAAMNGEGDILIGFSRSSGTVFPGLGVVGRRAADPLNTLQAEQVAIAGGGSQTGFTRWGDYTTMQVDPSDDRTFWYIGQYYNATSSFTWRTRIFSFSFPVTSPPVAINDAYSVNEDGSLNGATVLANDTDADGDPLTAMLASGPTNASNFSLSPDGTFSYTPNANFNGADSFTYKANDGSADSNVATVTITVNPVNDVPLVSASPETQSAQYSGAIATVAISADDVETPDATLSIAYSYVRNAEPSAAGLPTGMSPGGIGGAWTVSATGVPAGTYVITALVTDTGDGIALAITSAATFTINVTRENAVAVPRLSNPVAMQVGSPGGTASGTTGEICFDITEIADGSAGDTSLIDAATVQINVVGGGSAVSITPSNITFSGGGVGGTRSACFTLTLDETFPNVFEIVLEIGGDYYTGSGTTAFIVFDPSSGFASGVGWIINPNTNYRANYGVNVKYLRNGNAQGSILYIEHRPDGDYKVKSTSLNAKGGFAIVPVPGGGYEAQIAGKGNYGVNGVFTGNYSFIARVLDKSPTGTDEFGLKLIAPNGQVVSEFTFIPQALGGGNNQVPKK